MLNLSLLLHKKIILVSLPLNIFDLPTAPQIYIKYAVIFQISRVMSLERFTWRFALAHGAWETSGSVGPGKLLSLPCSFQVWSGADTHSPTSERDSVRHSCASMSYTQLARVKKEFCALLEDTDAMSEPAQARRMHRLEHGQHYDSIMICWRHQIISGILAISIFLIHHLSHRLEIAGRAMVLVNVLGNE